MNDARCSFQFSKEGHSPDACNDHFALSQRKRYCHAQIRWVASNHAKTVHKKFVNRVSKMTRKSLQIRAYLATFPMFHPTPLNMPLHHEIVQSIFLGRGFLMNRKYINAKTGVTAKIPIPNGAANARPLTSGLAQFMGAIILPFGILSKENTL